MLNKSSSIKELATALSLAQGEFPAVLMNVQNKFLGNKYADLGAIISTVRPILAKHGLSVVQPPTGNDNGIAVTTMLMHTSGEWIEASVPLPIGVEKGKSEAQVAGSIITYLRRYSLAGMLGVYADEDTDGNQPEEKPKPKAEVRPAKVIIEAIKAYASSTDYKSDDIEADAKKLEGTINNGVFHQKVEDGANKLVNVIFGHCLDALIGCEYNAMINFWIQPYQEGGKWKVSENISKEALAMLK